MQPQTLMLMLFGTYALDRDVSLGAGGLIEVLGRAGVSTHATRSTLSRMAARDLLRRHPVGRKMYFGLTERSTAILHDGRAHIWRDGAVNDRWDGTWTLLSFSLPESMQRERHDLRSRLAWEGFGPVQGGLWIAPGDVEAHRIVAELGLTAHTRVFRRARTDESTDVTAMIADAYDLPELAGRYEAFLDRWEQARMPVDPLAARLALIGEWLEAIRHDPRLPVEHLPADWPAARAQKVFRDREAAFREPAQAIADGLLDRLSSSDLPQSG
ncbi:PaaX family transcriptional regulator C-terminal domain-containing protein [Paractinoplanes ferrugineus]|uniref:PaaX family transcriptional regulator n=1 Tax=Paractinoplanes ferrugineus TaxID=113564 RepID=A0A919IZF8_9ACTN|nr:PaaX family transcriptional regulator C-terminal domain-containing protein [Actinoplanes ferrugineus]GIE11255.1 PaaX family transcriptional regulator [Actinoplanes ferrugineus]